MYRKLLGLCARAVLILAPLSSSAQGGLTYTSFDAPGSTQTTPEGINGAGTIVGVYKTSSTSLYHGFVRTASGAITEFDPSGSVDTHAVGINDAGTVVGQYGTGGSTYYGFIRDASGSISTYDLGNGHYTTFAAINDSGVIAGDAMINGIRSGLIRDAAGNVTYFSPVANSTETVSTAINSGGTILGEYTTSSTYLPTRLFLRDPGGNITTFGAPGATSTFAVSLNDSGAVAGNFTDSGGTSYGFIRDANGNFTIINNPFAPLNSSGYNNVFISSINNAGTVAGELFDQFEYVGFLRDASGNFTYFNPGGPADISSLSGNGGYAAGIYADPSNDSIYHGAFFPLGGGTAPEPSTLILGGLGLSFTIALGGSRSRVRASGR